MTSRFALSFSLVVASGFGAGCADRGLEIGNSTGRDFSTAFHDFGSVVDFGTVDLSNTSGCVVVDTFDSDQGVTALNENPSQSPGFAWDDYVEGFRSGNYPDGGTDILYYQFFEPQMMGNQPVMVPHALDFTNPNESVGLVLDYPFDGSSNGTDFVASSGDVTVTALDDTQPTGSVSVQGKDVTLQQTDDSGEILPNGQCILIHSFDLTAMYDGGGPMN